MSLRPRRDLELLDAISEDQHVTQRRLAARLGIALGLANLYVRRLIRKGYIKCVNVQSNRLIYLLTPAGVAEKTRLTYEFMEYSLDLFREVRRRLAAILAPLVTAGQRRVAIYGRSEAGELAYLSLRELGIEPVAVFDEEGGGDFLGIPVWALSDHLLVAYDLLIVASLDRSEPLASTLVGNGIPREKLVMLRPWSPE